MGWVHGYYWNTRLRKPSPHENISSGNETRKAHRWVAAWRLQHLQYGCTAVDSSWSWKEYASLLPPPSERTPISMTCWWDRQKKRGGQLMCVDLGDRQAHLGLKAGVWLDGARCTQHHPPPHIILLHTPHQHPHLVSRLTEVKRLVEHL